MNALLALLGNYDHRLLMAMVERRRRPLDRVMRSLTRLADPATSVAIASAIAVMPTDLRPVGRLALATLIISHLMVQVAKRTATRPRPALEPFTALIQAPACFSFPSGHAAAALSLALPLGVALSGPVGAFVLVVGLVVGISRCYLGVHYPGDVLAGWALTAIAYLIMA
jgi:undecaprenyl-diphosphatase